MIRIGSGTDNGMNRNTSDWLAMNSYPMLAPGKSGSSDLNITINSGKIFELEFNPSELGLF